MTYTLPKKYQNMNEAELQTALADKNDSQVIHELSCLVNLYTRQVKTLIQDGKNPYSLLTSKSSALENMALRIVLEATQEPPSRKG